MTLSLPSFLAAATSSLIPPPAEADAALSQPFPLLEPGEEPDEQPVTSNARAAGAASAMSAKRCGDLTGDCLLLTPRPLGARADRRSPQRRNVQGSFGHLQAARGSHPYTFMHPGGLRAAARVSRGVTDLTPEIGPTFIGLCAAQSRSAQRTARPAPPAGFEPAING